MSEYLNVPGLQGIASIVGLFTFIGILVEKILYIFNITEFDKIFIPKNKIKIYEGLKTILILIIINICLYAFASTTSSITNLSEKTVSLSQAIVSNIFSISFLLLIFIAIFIKVIRKIIHFISSKFVKDKKIIDDWVIVNVTLKLYHIPAKN